jgi:light-regulated signal transduction histidine kinase (bacteriophytochrome)
VQDDLQEKIHAASAAITVEKLPEIKAVPFQFKQLFTNVIANSIKFARPGIAPQIKIKSIISEKVKFNGEAVFPAGKYHLITVEDNGIGFDSQYNSHVFGIFKRLHGRAEYEGTGIGLSIVKKIVENHNGMITAEGETGKGTVISIYLPLDTAPAAQPAGMLDS